MEMMCWLVVKSEQDWKTRAERQESAMGISEIEGKTFCRRGIQGKQTFIIL